MRTKLAGELLALALAALLLAGCANPKQKAQGLAGQSVLVGVTFNQMLSLSQLREKLGGAKLYLKGMDFVVGRKGSHHFIRPSSWLPKPEFLQAQDAVGSAQSERIFTKNGPKVDPEILGFGEGELYDQFHAILEELSRERE